MNVLSLFDGMSCGRLALERADIGVNKYYASEIDKHATKVTQSNYPNTIQLGGVEAWRQWEIDWSSVDLIIGGSPCQGFSFAGKQLAFDDPRSKLFFIFVDIINHVKKFNPNVKFLLENVKMKKEFLDVISKKLEVKPILICSSLVSAQRRKRYYWANWYFDKPSDKGILLKDVVHEKADMDAVMSDGWCKWFKDNAEYQLRKAYSSLSPEKAITMTARQYASWNGNFLYEVLKEYIVPFRDTLTILDKEVARGKVGYFNTDSQSSRVYYIHDKAVTLTGEGGGGAANMGQYLFGCITPDRINKRQNGQRFNDGNKFYTLTKQDRHGILVEGYIRKLTPVECERLQSIPDNYTESVSNTQRYKMLGNGWTVDVISHILSYLKVKK